MILILIAINMNTYHNDIPCVYIEQTKQTLQQRKLYHYHMSQVANPKSPFHRVVKHLGPSVFRWEVLATTHSQEKANQMEKFYKKEYKSEVIGYNREVNQDKVGENHPRFGDRRTWDERFGKERSAEIKAKYSKSMSESEKVKEHSRALMLSNHPYRKASTREAERQRKLGVKNPKAQFDYILTKDDGSELVIPCLSEYCREHPEMTAHGIWTALQRGSKYKGMSVKRIPKVKEKDILLK